MSKLGYFHLPIQNIDDLGLSAVWECKKEAASVAVSFEVDNKSGPTTEITYYDDQGDACPYGLSVPGNPYQLNDGQVRTYPMGSSGSGAPPRVAGAGAGGDTISAYDATFNGEPIISVTDAVAVSANDFLNAIVLSVDSTASFRRLIATLDDATTVTGSEVADEIEVGAGNDSVAAGAGDDTLRKWSSGDLTYDGGSGTDALLFRATMGDVYPNAPTQQLIVNLATGAGQNPYGGTLSLTPNSVENIIGTAEADQITGSDAGNVIGDPFDTGADVINALGGDDVISLGWSAAGGVTVNGGDGFDELRFLVTDQLSSASTITFDLQNPAANTFRFAGGTFTGIEKFFASGGGSPGEQDTFVFGGSDAAEIVVGTSGTAFGTPAQRALVGRDQLFGRGGDDFLDGRTGNDLLDGGAGTDTAVISTGVPSDHLIRTYLSGGVLTTTVITQAGASVGVGNIDTLVAIERIQYDALVGTTNGTFTLAGADLNNLSNVAGSRFDDVLIQNGTDGQVYFARESNGAFQSWGAVTGAMGSDWKAIATGDVNPSAAQGAAETFVQQQSTGTIYYASLDTGSTVWGVVSSSLTSDWKLRAVADVNGDASADAIVQNQTSGTIYFADMKGGTFQNWGVVNANLTSDWVASGAGDVNGDGFADVVVQQQSTGTTYFASMAGGAFAGWGVVSSNLTSDWSVKAVADVTRDGIADVIFQNPNANGLTYYADLKTGAPQWGVVASSISQDWVVQGVADIDNDGAADVLFQNTSTGTTYAAEVNGSATGVPAWSAVTTTITPDWHVV